MSIYIGIDNGSTGSIGIVSEDTSLFFPTPVIQVPNYTKEVKIIGRINIGEIKKIFLEILPKGENVRCLVERPFMSPITSISYEDFLISKTNNPDLSKYLLTKKKIATVNMMFLKASLNAHRSFEATILILESMKIGYEVVDSKQWQKEILGNGIKGSKALKEASKLKGIQLFPHLEKAILKQKDADGLLIAEFARRYYNQ
jgi:hypothetical protein